MRALDPTTSIVGRDDELDAIGSWLEGERPALLEIEGEAGIAAGKFTPIPMKVSGPAGQTVKATFAIVLKTNGRPTTEKKAVQVSFSK
jgi:hypothetical protein